jgi:hypothetical protein
LASAISKSEEISGERSEGFIEYPLNKKNRRSTFVSLAFREPVC